MQRTLRLPMGGFAVYVQGVSVLVRHHQAIFLTRLEKEKVLDRRVAKLRATGAEMLRVLADTAGMSAFDRADAAHDLSVRLLDALSYERTTTRYAVLDREESGNHAVPLLAELRLGEQPHVHVIETALPYAGENLLDGLARRLRPLPDDATEAGLQLPEDLTVGEAVVALFASTARPRWVVVLGRRDAILAERGRWARGQFLRFDLEILLRRRKAGALRVTCALLSRELLAPGAGRPLPEALLENSHQHAVGVSAELKFGAREPVELLGNEVVHYMRTTSKKALYGDPVRESVDA